MFSNLLVQKNFIILDKANDAIKIEKKIPVKKLDSLPDNVTKSHEVYKKNGWSSNVASQPPGNESWKFFQKSRC